jgi:hypothetical protein
LEGALPGISTLEPSGITVAASPHDEQFALWKDVGKLQEKVLGAAAKRVHPRIRTLIIAQAQPFDGNSYENNDPNLPIYLEPGPGPDKLTFIRVEPGEHRNCLREAARLLWLHQQKQRRSRPVRPTLPDPCIARPGFRNALEKFFQENASGILVIHGAEGCGKSTAMCWLINEWENDECHEFIFSFIGQTGCSNKRTVEDCLSDQVKWKFGFGQKDGRVNLVSLIRSLGTDKTVARDKKLVILIDAPERMEDITHGHPVPAIIPEDLPDGVYCIIATRSPDHLNSKGLIHVAFNDLVDQDKEGRLLVERRNDKTRWD